MRTSRPSNGDGISALTLSVTTSTIGSSRRTVSPSALSQRSTVPSVTDSPSCGIFSVVKPIRRFPAQDCTYACSTIRWRRPHTCMGGANGSSIPIRYLHRPEHDLGEKRRALAVVRAAWLRERLGMRSPRPAQPSAGTLPRGMDLARGPRGTNRKNPDRGARDVQYVPPPVCPGQDGGHRGSHLQRAVGDWARRRLVRT